MLPEIAPRQIPTASRTPRRHGLNAGVAEYRRLLDVYPSLSYEVTILPKVSVHERADFVLHTLAE